jgi:hypothetical protein
VIKANIMRFDVLNSTTYFSRKVILHSVTKFDLMLTDYYKQGHRNAFTFGLGGLALRRYIAEESVSCIVKELCINTNGLETESRLDVVHLNRYMAEI